MATCDGCMALPLRSRKRWRDAAFEGPFGRKSWTEQVCGAKQRQSHAAYPSLERQVTIHLLPLLGVRVGRAKETNGLPKPSHTGRGAKPTGLVSGRTRPSTNAPSKLARTSSPGRVGGSGSAGDFDGWHDVECRSRQRRLCMCDGPLMNVTTDRVYRAEAFSVRRFQPSRSRRTWILPSSHNLPNVLSQNSLTFPICSSISVFKCRAPACQSSVV